MGLLRPKIDTEKKKYGINRQLHSVARPYLLATLSSVYSAKT